MAGIDQLPSGKTRVRWRVGKQRYTRTFDSLAEAKRFAAAVEADPAAPQPTMPRYDQWAAAWYKHHITSVRPSSADRYRKMLNLYVIPHLGFLPLDEITPSIIRAWQSNLLASGLAPATVRLARTVANMSFDVAVTDELITLNPFTRVKGVNVPKTEVRILDEDEILLLADSINARWRALILVAAYGGLRIGELAALQPANLNEETHQVSVVGTETRAARGARSVGPPKTASSRRVIQLPKFVMVELEEHFARGYASETRIFTGIRGGALDPDYFRRAPWVSALKVSGLAPLRVHDLRHAAVSLWIREGASPKLIAYRAGHSSAAYVLDVYGHLFGGEDAELAARLDAGRPPMSPFRGSGSPGEPATAAGSRGHSVDLI